MYRKTCRKWLKFLTSVYIINPILIYCKYIVIKSRLYLFIIIIKYLSCGNGEVTEFGSRLVRSGVGNKLAT